MDSIPAILATAYGTLMVGSALTALALGERKRKRDLRSLKVVVED